ncbi:hypothetical protein DPMN_089129 [Dreissena polymorpha]|uniref:Uncharacterized protein n=1 Tax=Dreissena polymorpha TaxID=45954 RepID=A0A9D4KX71_DREPO|nr:hypothetical protein DPMN_089129 [Dreissena polymorpha]
MRQDDDESATIRCRECKNTMAKIREGESTMTRMRQFNKMTTVRKYDGENAMARMR